MIINTGQRTDIPAFYSKWLVNRIKAGYVLVRNPYYPNLVTKFIINPDVVDVIGFCTKNPRPMLKYLEYLKPYGQIWHITITGFGKDLEPNVPDIKDVINDFKYLSNNVGKNSIIFRYTPIIINDKYTVEYHINTFRYIVSEIHDYTNIAIFGFIDLYDKLIKYHKEINDCSDEDKILIAKEFLKITKEYNLELRLCSKEKWLREYGIDVNGCMRIEDYERAIGKRLIVKSKMQARKNYCSCYLSNDIGAYNSCMHFCSYCYANKDKNSIINNYNMHNDDSPFLIGESNKNDQIKEAKQESWIDDLPSLF